MAGNSKRTQVVKKRGFSFLSLLLGFLLGIIFIVGALVGGAYFGLTSDLDKVLSIFGLDNSKDESGKNRYVNTDEAAGGARSALDLIKRIVDMASGYETLTVGQIENLLPATTPLIDSLGDTLTYYANVDMEEFRAVEFSKFSDYVSEVMLDIEPAVLMDKLGQGEAMSQNKLLNVLLVGAEAQYVKNGSEAYPVYYDVYVTDDGENYTRRDDGTALPKNLVDCLDKDAVPEGERQTYTLYHYLCHDRHYATYENDDGSMAYTGDDPSYEYGNFNEDIQKCTGTYYYVNGDKDGEKITLYPLTVRDYVEGTATDALNRVKITEFIEISGDRKIVDEVLGDITVGMFLNSTINFNEILNGVHLPTVVSVDFENPILAYLGYGITDVTPAEGQDYSYTATYTDPSGEKIECYIKTGDDGNKVYYIDDGKEVDVPETTIKEVSEKVDSAMDVLALPDLLDIEEPTAENNNAILIFLGYSLAGLEKQPDGRYKAKYYPGTFTDVDGKKVYDTVECYIEAKNGKLLRAYTEEAGVKTYLEKTKLENISTQLNMVTDVLTLGEIVTVTEDDGILYELRDKTITEIPDAINELQLKQVIDIDDSNRVMKKLGEYKIGELSNAMDELTLPDFLTIYLTDVKEGSPADSELVIMTYIAYGVTALKAETGNFEVDGVTKNYTHTGTYHALDGEKYPCYIVTQKTMNEEEDEIFEVWYYLKDDKYIQETGTAVTGVNGRIDGVTKDLTIGELMQVDESNTILSSLKDSTISTLSDDINKLAINTLYAEQVYALEKDGTQFETVKRKVVDSSTNPTQVQTSDYDVNQVYYTFDGSKYSLANGTGRLTSDDFSEGPYYSYGKDGDTYLIGFDTSFVYYTDDNMSELAENSGKLTAFSDGVYTYGPALGIWRILLCDRKDGGANEQVFTVNGIPDLVTSITENLKSCTMRELHESGVITFETPAVLDEKMPGGAKTYGASTLDEVITAFNDYLVALPGG